MAEVEQVLPRGVVHSNTRNYGPEIVRGGHFSDIQQVLRRVRAAQAPNRFWALGQVVGLSDRVWGAQFSDRL